MEASTVERPAERSDQDRNVVTFVSTDASLRLIHTPRVPQLGSQNEVFVTPGKRFEFQDGELVIDEDASEDLEWLRNHEQFGALFVERGDEPDRPTDSSAATLEKLVNLLAERDVEGIADIYVAERSQHGRNDVLRACEAALRSLEAEVPAPPPVPTHQQERVRAADAVGDQPGVTPSERPSVESPAPEPDATERAPVPGTEGAPEAPAEGEPSPYPPDGGPGEPVADGSEAQQPQAGESQENPTGESE